MSDKTEENNDESVFLSEWGFTLKDLYNLALSFFKDKDGKAMHFSYEERLKLVALTCQISQGKFNPEHAPPLGVLDVIGRDRRVAWQAIGDKQKSDCMFEFINSLNKQCPLFKPFVEANKRDLEEKRKINLEAHNHQQEQLEEYQMAKEIERKAEEESFRIEEQKRRIQDALNSQTFSQFKLYAEQQYPGNPEQQGVLIRQLQEQHYDQYMRQIYQQQLFTNQEGNENIISLDKNDIIENNQNSAEKSLEKLKIVDSGEDDENNLKIKLSTNLDSPNNEEAEAENDTKINNNIAPASMWTRKDVQEFKDSVRSEGGEAIIRIGQGESVTVRVPTTQPDGTCLFWEFATDSYDIGFGLFFEWTNVDEPVSIQVTDENSTDDEEDDETFAALEKDLERGHELPKGAKPNTDVVIPVYRRDSHLEVYVGSSLFPGKGVYLLKFDNSYSFWRSKTLYYRVYYTK